MDKAKFNIPEAKVLWVNGWCFNGLGKKYGYSKWTIKKYVKPLVKESEWLSHHKNHRNCPFCYNRVSGEQLKII